MDKLIITAALTGAETTRDDNPNLPVTPEEIVEAAVEACQAGASIIHLHVRDRDGNPTQSAEIFGEVMEKIKSRCSAILQVSTGGAVGMSAAERAAPLDLNPEMASLTTGTVNFGKEVFSNPMPLVEELAGMMQKQGVKPEVEVFDAGMISSAGYLVRKDLLNKPLHYDFVMGVPGGISAGIRELVFLVDSILPGSTWTAAGIGRHELTLGTAAILMGGHVRVGFEDNIYFEKGVLAKSNAQLVERVARVAQVHQRPVATPDEARQILNLT
ncbi:MAG: 3-keto-5-aminohexanoate cleavage protein [Bacillota bacterium]